jgi:hypothetical protein
MVHMNDPCYPVSGEGFSLYLDGRGNLQEIRLADARVRFPIAHTLYEIDGQEAEILDLSHRETLSFRMTAGEVSGTLSVASGSEVAFHLEPHPQARMERVGLSLFFPIDTVFHLAEFRNIGRKLDRDMPVGESHRCRLSYNLALGAIQGTWLRFRVDHPRHSVAEIEIARHPEMFAVTWTWPAGADLCLGVFPSMAQAVEDFQRWIERSFRVKKLRDPRRNLPAWIHNVRLVLTADMMRSNWQVSHDYGDVLHLARKLRQAGCPQDTLIYLPGWQGAYDSTHPTYRPHPELGGSEGFRAMVEGIHDCGYRVMIHTTGWGIDPYHPDIDRLQELALKDEEGDYRGWQLNRKWYPPRRDLKFRTGKVPLGAGTGSRSFAFETGPIPDRCEATIAVGGVRVGGARVRLTAGRRRIASPPGWFEQHAAYEYPFPLLLEPGVNRIQVDVIGDAEPDWGEGWYQLRYCFGPKGPYASWTWPILMANTSDPEYIRLFVENVSAVVNEYQIDAVHVDATWFDTPQYAPPSRELLLKLREALGGVPICGEAVLEFEEMGTFCFVQSAAQSLLGERRGPAEQGSLTTTEGVQELYHWLNVESEVCRFARDYGYHYPHLCAANAFVPVGKVCNTFPPRRMPRTSSELWKVLQDARRLDYVPGLRVNYREHGLDEETRRAIAELAE